MLFDTDGMEPIYVQISDWLENEILSGNINIDEKIYSQYQLAKMFNINPATAAKGLNILVDEDILYKKRGLGMFVSQQGRDIILKKRKDQTLKKMVYDLIVEARRLGIDIDGLVDMVRSLDMDKGE